MAEQEYNDKVWMLGYDLRSEHGAELSDAQKSFLSRMRSHIWHELRYKYKCAPIQHSLWLVRGEKTYTALKDQVKAWVKEYEDNGFKGTIQTFPAKTTKEGMDVFRNWELNFLLEWLAGVEESCERLSEKGTWTKRELTTLLEKVDLIENIMTEDFGKDHVRWREMSHQIQIANDRVREMKSKAA